MSRQIVYRIIYVPCLLALSGLVVTFAHPVHAPVSSTQMKTYQASDNSFRISYPAEWHKLSFNQNGTGARARFQRGPHAEVVVTCDLTGSLMMDFSRNGNASGVPLPGMEGLSSGSNGAGGQKTPIQAAHATGAMHLGGEFRHYEEKPATPAKVGGYEALASAFTGETPDMFNAQEIVGKRITVLAGNHPVTIEAFCPKNDQEGFFSTVDAMLKTLSISEAEG